MGQKRVLAQQIVMAHPHITENRTLAKLLHNKYPLIFKDVEDARTIIRTAIGKRGKKQISPNVEAFAERLAKLRQQHQLSAERKIDTTPYKIKGFSKALVIGDLHLPFHDQKSIDIALEYGYRANVDLVIINGDLLDFASISRFLSKPDEMRMIDNIDAGKKMLAYIKDALGCKVIFHEGNHDVRCEHYLMRQAPEFWGLASIELKNLLGCDEMNIGHVSNIRTMHFGKLTIAHGNHIVKGVFAPVNPARGAFVRANASILINHCHRTSTHIESDIKGHTTGAFSAGCLCDIRPEYNPMVAKFNQGFAVVELENNHGDFVVDNRMIIDYKVR